MHYIWSYCCNISLKNIPKNNSEESRAGQSIEIRIYAHQDCNGFLSLMLLVKKTPSSVSKVTSVAFRANQQGFNDIFFFVLQLSRVQVNPTSLCKHYAADAGLHPAKPPAEVRQQGTDDNEGFFFCSQQKILHTHLHISASVFRYVHVYLYRSHKIICFLHMLVLNMFSQ